jgi:AcrR family transcriptional regulator
LTRADVVDAAVRIADRDGLERLSLQAVADALEIRSPSLYAHVDGLRGLRRLLSVEGARRLAVVLGAGPPAESGAAALRRFAAAIRRFARNHPGLYDAAQLAVPVGEDDEVYRALAEPVEVVAATLRADGHADAEIVPIIRGLRSAVHGFVLLERRGGFGMPSDVEDSFALLVDLLIAGIETRLGPDSAR